MKTKTKKIILCVLMLLPLAATLIAMQFLPDQIPAHYNFSGQVDRWGSKYEALMIPALAIGMGLFMLGMAEFCARREESGRNNENICLVLGIVSTLIFDAITGFFLYTSFSTVENLSSIAIDVDQIVFGILGLSMVVMGNLMPKLRMNAVIGLRTGWSMKNETTWKKSQRFGGISFIAAGILMMAACCLTKEIACIGISLGILILVSIVDVYYTYRIAKIY